MLHHFARRFSKIGNALHFLTPEDIDERFLDEKNLYKRDIITSGLNLELFEEDLVSAQVIAQEIEKISFLTYAGGVAASKCAAGYVPKLVAIMEREELRNDIKVAILRGVSVIALAHADNQAICFEEGMFSVASDVILGPPDKSKLWAIYCLYTMVYDNIPYLQILKEQQELCDELHKASQLSWVGFAHNYALLILRLTGIKRLKLQSKMTRATKSIKEEESEVEDTDKPVQATSEDGRELSDEAQNPSAIQK